MERKNKINWGAVAGITGALAGLGIGAAVGHKFYNDRKNKSVVVELEASVLSNLTVQLESCDPSDKVVSKKFDLHDGGAHTLRVYSSFNPAVITITTDLSYSVEIKSVTRKDVDLLADAETSRYFTNHSGEVTYVGPFNTAAPLSRRDRVVINRSHIVCSENSEQDEEL